MIKTVTADVIHKAIAPKLASGVSLIDALCDYAEKNNIEIEVIAGIVKKSDVLRTKVREEATRHNMIKKEKNDASAC